MVLVERELLLLRMLQELGYGYWSYSLKTSVRVIGLFLALYPLRISWHEG